MYTISNPSSGQHQSSERLDKISLNRGVKNDGGIFESPRYKTVEIAPKYRFSQSYINSKKYDYDDFNLYESTHPNRIGRTGEEKWQNSNYSLQHLNGYLPSTFSKINGSSNKNVYSSGINSGGYSTRGNVYGAFRSRGNENNRSINPTSQLIQNYSKRNQDYSPNEFDNQSNNVSHVYPMAARRAVNGGNTSGFENTTFKSTSSVPQFYTSPYVGSYTNNAFEIKPLVQYNINRNKSMPNKSSVLNTWSNESPKMNSIQNHAMVNDTDMHKNSTYDQALNKNFEEVQERKIYSSTSPHHNGLNGRSDNLPLSPSSALMIYGQQLTNYERKEIFGYPQVYFLGLSAPKRHPSDNEDFDVISDCFEVTSDALKTIGTLNGFDDAQSSYVVVLNDHIAYRYEIIGHLGKGSFGQVVQAKDHYTKKDVAIKIIRSEEKFTRQAREEINILKVLNEQDKENTHNIIQLLDSFIFRKHVCMVFELLNLNLYELLHRNLFRGLSQGTVCRITRGILDCLTLMYDNQIIHCDLKPENILLRQGGLSAVKVIDFGSSCFVDKRIYTYIQSRYYRAPEIILGMQYGTAIDMWSLGCIVAELITGLPLFPGEDEEDQLACIMEIIGAPPNSMKFTCRKSNKYFTTNGQPRYLSEQTESRSEQKVIANGFKVHKDKDSEVNGGGSLSKSGSSVSLNHKKVKQRSRHWKPRQPPGSVSITTALTGPKQSSVYMVTSEYTKGSHWSKLAGSRTEPIDPDMVDFISSCLRWWPKERMLPKEALQHPWILKHKVGNKQCTPKIPSVCERNARYGDLLKKTYDSPTFYLVPESSEVAEEVRKGMQAVKLRRPLVRNSAETRRSSQITSKVGRDLSRSYKRYSTGHETIHHLMGSTNLSRSSSSDLSKLGLVTEPTNQYGATEIREFREFLDGDLTDGLMASVNQSAANGRLSENFVIQRPRRTSGHRISSLLYTNGVQQRRCSPSYENNT